MTRIGRMFGSSSFAVSAFVAWAMGLAFLVSGGYTEEEALDESSVLLTPGSGSESSVAIHPSDPNLVVVGVGSPTDVLSGLEYSYSTDGGSTWFPSVVFSGGKGNSDPAVAWSADGQFVYTGFVQDAYEDVYFYRSSDNGVSWEDLGGGILVADTPSGEFEYAQKVKLHVDTSGSSAFQEKLYLMWGTSDGLWFAASSDRGESWTIPQAMTDGSPPAEVGDLVTDRSGVLHYFWLESGENGIDHRVLMMTSTDGGVSFSAPSEVSNLSAKPFGLKIPYADISGVSVSLSAATDLSDGPNGGRIYIAWVDSTSVPSDVNPEDNHARVVVAYSDNNGTSWTLTTPHRTDNVNQVDRFAPTVEVAEDGAVYVAFLSSQGASDAREAVRPYAAFSIDGGDSFSAPATLIGSLSPRRDTVQQVGRYNGLSISGDQLIATTSDTRDEDGTGPSLDVYASGLILDDYVDACLGTGDGLQVLGSVEHGIRFVADRDFSAIEFRIAGSTAMLHVADIELRRSSGFEVVPEIIISDVTAFLGGVLSPPPFVPSLRIDLGPVLVSGPEEFTVKFNVKDGGDGNIYFESFGEGDVRCSDVVITADVTSSNPEAVSSPAGFRVIAGDSVDPPGGGCAVAEALSDGSNLRHHFSTLYELRDSLFTRSEFGRELNALHTEHSWEAASLVLRTPLLQEKLRRLLEETRPLVKALNTGSGADVRLSKEAIEVIEAYVFAVASEAQPPLRYKLIRLWHRTALWSYEGQRVDEVWEALASFES